MLTAGDFVRRMMRTVLKTAATCEPLTPEDVESFAKVDGEDERALMLGLIKAAREYAERATGRQLITATYTAYMDHFPPKILLPYPPLQTVGSVKYLDSSGTETTLVANTDYMVKTTSEPGFIIPAYGEVWPSTYAVPDAVYVEYTCGYGTTAASVPETILMAMRQLVAHWYTRRLPIITGTIVADTPKTLDVLLAGYWHGHTWS